MGTRHLIIVIQDGTTKVAQYGQWDGYPSYTGVRLAKFFRMKGKNTLSLSKLRTLKKAMQCCFFVPQDEYEANLPLYENEPSLDISTGWEVIPLISKNARKGTRTPLTNMWGFAYESLFCEWAYVINLDTDEIEVYKGFNKKRLRKSERFYREDSNRNEYYPVKHVLTVPLATLAETPDEQLIKQMEGSS